MINEEVNMENAGTLQAVVLGIDNVSDGNEQATKTNTLDILATISGALHNSKPVVCGNVSVTNSKNVQMGHNTYFNGPVTIKQIVQSPAVENESYVQNDPEDFKDKVRKSSFSTKTVVKGRKIQMWHKIGFVIGCIIFATAVCVAILTSRHEDQDLDFSTYDANSSNTSLIIAPFHLRIVSRTDWLAQPPVKPLDKIKQPVPWVIITHTATESCNMQSECVLRVRLIQMFHVESRGWYDIAYNFLIGGDGSVYYGRGWDYEGAHTKGYNKYSIAIAFIGTFNSGPPPKQQLDACKKLIKMGVELGKLSPDYKLLSHRQLMSTLSPGEKLHSIIKEWPHFVSNVSSISELLPSLG